MMQLAIFYPLTALFFLNVVFWPIRAEKHVDWYTDEPKLTLPWGTYVASPYGEDGKVAVFKNVRFGQAPTGNLRFKASKFPETVKNNAVVQDTTYGPICIQAGTPDSKTGQLPPAKAEESEDCLFLDIYVPYTALKAKADKLPVVVYIYGGAYFYGYKDSTIELKGYQNFTLYNGKGMMDAANNDFIWVVGNYRVGAFGFLAGSSMEAGGTPNAGLHDQRLLLEFVQDYIVQVGGDNSDVSVWGNSAGAGSIIHHLTAKGGQQDPLFQKAVLWSPAYQWSFDRKKTLEDTFQAFAVSAGCRDDPTLTCLQGKDVQCLRKANQDIVLQGLSIGMFSFGPAVDGSYITDLPATSFSRGEHADIQSVIVSHVYDEAGLFLPSLSYIKTQDDFTKFLQMTFPGDDLAEVREIIDESYPVSDDDDTVLSQQLRVKRLLRDSTFICNSRQVFNAYRGNAYMMQFNFPPGLHGSDLLPTTWNKDVNIREIIDIILSFLPKEQRRTIEGKLAGFSSTYQKYFAGHAAFGDPNSLIDDDATVWSPGRDFIDIIRNTMHVGLSASGDPYFELRPDLLNRARVCAVWDEIANLISEISSNSAFEEMPPALRGQPGRPRSSWWWEL